MSERNKHNYFDQYQVDSAFQPIISMGHQRPIGYEALVRGIDHNKKRVSPAELFNLASYNASKIQLDQLCQRVHVENFLKVAPDNTWLFLNIDPVTLDNRQYRDFLPNILKQFGLPFHRLVVELLEGPAIDESDLFDAVDYFHSAGALVALDDFGSGQANFDRVWRLAPDIIKFDRTVILEASKHIDGKMRRMLPDLVAMMHEAGSLVCVEGIEDENQLMIALDAEADFVQGFYLSHPNRTPVNAEIKHPKMVGLHQKLVKSDFLQLKSQRLNFKEYIHEIRSVQGKFEFNDALQEACERLLVMPNVVRVFLLDENGVELTAFISPDEKRNRDKRFDPMINTQGSNWSHREYFRSAIEQPQQVQISRSYLSSTEGQMCVVLSISNYAEPRRVFCCKIMLD